VRPDAGWCTLCFASLGQAFDPLTAPLDEVVGQSGGGSVVTGGPGAVMQPATEPADQRPVAPIPGPDLPAPEGPVAPGDTEAIAPIDDVEVMLGMLAAEHRQADRTADLAEQLSNKGTRTAVMLGGALVMTLVLFLLLFAAGLFT